MTDLGQLKPGRIVPSLDLRREDGLTALARSVQARVGAAHAWRSFTRTDQEWEEWAPLNPHRQYWLIRLAGEPVGITKLEPKPGGEVEVRTFGLLPVALFTRCDSRCSPDSTALVELLFEEAMKGPTRPAGPFDLP
ncbi:hypothetical protein [Streptacidiphilus fuscans]|uniref:GNAT family N-acetyltransferase n=1 Tax=Streptacidiphilus fuscans TaxID=2789292 RepID=A0A931FG71_9ACTN|nr:hypothetical protein [Streptacidiphilus fuscans]MBF9069199.1 hypothetical protein [Streptacidiphilus fuscans]